MFLLNIVLYKPILKVLDERDQRIDGQQLQAKQVVEEGQALMGDYNQKLYAAKVDAMNAKNAARSEASNEANVIIEKARKDAEDIITQMQQQMASEISQAKKELEPELGVMASTIAQQIMGRKVA
jgi:F-type H+-transporting ATPase subunit b